MYIYVSGVEKLYNHFSFNEYWSLLPFPSENKVKYTPNKSKSKPTEQKKKKRNRTNADDIHLSTFKKKVWFYSNTFRLPFKWQKCVHIITSHILCEMISSYLLIKKQQKKSFAFHWNFIFLRNSMEESLCIYIVLGTVIPLDEYYLLVHIYILNGICIWKWW